MPDDLERAIAFPWDLIFLDAYGASGIPDALATDAFFADVAGGPAADGFAVANIADRSATPRAC